MTRVLVLVVGLVLLGGCTSAVPMQGDGVAARSERSVTAFQALQVAGPVEVTVEVQEGTTPTLVFTGDANLLSVVAVDATGEVLRVDARGVQPTLPLTLKVLTPSSVPLDATEGARVSAEQLHARR